MKKTHLILSIAAVLFIGVGTAQAVSVWNEPVCGPTGCNTDIPLNVGALPQNREGNLGIGFPVGSPDPARRLHVNGTIGISNQNFLDLGLGIKANVPGVNIGRVGYTNTSLSTPVRPALQLFGGRTTANSNRLIEVFDDLNVFGNIRICTANGSCSPVTGGGDGLWVLNGGTTGSSISPSVISRRVGIGTNSPFADLHVGDTNGNGSSVLIGGGVAANLPAKLLFYSGNNQTHSIYRPASSGDLLVTTGAGATEKTAMVFKDNGFVGIGTSPTAKFHIKLATDANVKMYSGAGKVQWDVKNDGGQKIPLNIEASPIALTGGNVGVGTLSPNTFKLEIAGHTGPSEDNRFDLGSPTKRWANLYATNIYECVESGSCTEISGGGGGDSKWASSTNSRNNISNKNLTGSVGIGTTTPTSRLHVDGTARVDGLLAVFGNMYSSGKVGLGTNAPATKLDIDNGTTNYAVGLIARTVSTLTGTSQLPVAVISNNTNTVNTGVGLRFGAKNGNGSNNAPLAQISAVTEQVSTGAVNYGGLQFSTANGARFVDAMRISNAGKVGIGTNSPSTNLHVVGTIGVDGASFSASELGRLKFGAFNLEGKDVGYIRYRNANPQSLDVYGGVVVAEGVPMQPRLIRLFDDVNIAGKLTVNRICTTSGVCFDTSSVGGPWLTTGNNISNTNSGNVGVGTNSPTAKLHVANTNSVNTLVESTSGNASISLKAGAQPTWIMSNLVADGDFRLARTDPNGGTKVFVDKETGNVGIANTNPQEKLHIGGRAIQIQPTSDESVSVNLYAPGSRLQLVSMRNTSGNLAIVNADADGGGSVKVGIGTSNPQQALDVNGMVSIRGGAPGPGKVLTSTGTSGAAEWKDLPGLNSQKVCVAVGRGATGANIRRTIVEWYNQELVPKSQITIPKNAIDIKGPGGNTLIYIPAGDWYNNTLFQTMAVPELSYNTLWQIPVPVNWSPDDCRVLVNDSRAGVNQRIAERYQLGCLFSSGTPKYSYGNVTIEINSNYTPNSIPPRDCGWQ